MRSRLIAVDHGAELSWTGRAAWITAVHRTVFIRRSDGGCTVTTSESMTGLGVSQLLPEAVLVSQLCDLVEAIGQEAARRCA